jgi:2'-5' RNA ligase
MKRTFWALKVAPQIADLIRLVYADIPELKRGIRLVPPENVHITLKFLGDTEEQQLGLISAAVKEQAPAWRSFPITVAGTGTFPNARHPRVIFLGIKDGLEKLREISNIIENCMEHFGYDREKRAFTPHLTIGRVKDERQAINAVESLLRYQYQPVTFSTTEIVFFESTLTPQGAIYTPLEIITLK